MRTKITCQQCHKENSTTTKRKYCSRVCYFQSRLGKKSWNSGVKTGIAPMLGKKHTTEAKLKIGLASIGNQYGLNGKGRLGQRNSEESLRKIGDAHRGEKSRFWIDGRSVGENKHEYYLHQNRLRKALKKGAEGSYNHTEWQELKQRYNFICPSCKLTEPEIKLTADHIVPLKLGGSNNIENIQPLCGSCNSRKHTKIIAYAI